MTSRSSAPGRGSLDRGLRLLRRPVGRGSRRPRFRRPGRRQRQDRNYFGFPTGISGQALTARAFVQAQKFGADIMIPVAVKAIDCLRANHAFVLETDDGARIQARTIVVASGARYRHPRIADIARFEGRGIWYWASQIEARLCAGEEVILVGGGNSAGQGAVFLSGHASKVRMMVRGPGLAESMSRYLIDRIDATRTSNS